MGCDIYCNFLSGNAPRRDRWARVYKTVNFIRPVYMQLASATEAASRCCNLIMIPRSMFRAPVLTRNHTVENRRLREVWHLPRKPNLFLA